MQTSELSSKIKTLCRLKKIPVKVLLEECGMNRNTIYDLEHKGAYPSYDKILKIAEYFDISIDYLAGRTDNPDSHKSSKTFRIPYSGEDDTRAVAYGLDNEHYIPEDDEDEIKTT